MKLQKFAKILQMGFCFLICVIVLFFVVFAVILYGAEVTDSK